MIYKMVVDGNGRYEWVPEDESLPNEGELKANLNTILEEGELDLNTEAVVGDERHDTVAGLIINDKKEILSMFHNKLQMINLPAGKLDKGETYEEALKREMFEEIGIEVVECRAISDFKVGKNINIKLFIVDKYKGTITNKEPEKHKDLRFRSLKELKFEKDKSESLKQSIVYLTESVNSNKNKVDELASIIKEKKKFPIFLIFNDSPSLTSQIIKIFTQSPFSHIGISLSSTNDIICFNNDSATGLIREDFFSFLNRRQPQRMRIDMILLSKDTYTEVIKTISYYFDNIHKTKYDYKILPKIALGMREMQNKSFDMVCSSFVANLFVGVEEMNAMIGDSARNIMKAPGDIYKALEKTVYNVYDGSPLDYSGDVVKEIMVKSGIYSKMKEIKAMEIVKRFNLFDNRRNVAYKFQLESVTYGFERTSDVEMSDHNFICRFIKNS